MTAELELSELNEQIKRLQEKKKLLEFGDDILFENDWFVIRKRGAGLEVAIKRESGKPYKQLVSGKVKANRVMVVNGLWDKTASEFVKCAQEFADYISSADFDG